jgi:dynein heavy chain
MKASDSTLLKMLELAVQFGKWILVENVGTELDPALDPIISRQIHK